MKTILTLSAVTLLFVISSCSKDEDSSPCSSTSSTPVVSQEKVTFYNDVQPIIARDCASSNCHAAGSKSSKLTSVDQVIKMANDGSFKHRLFTNGNVNPCNSIDARSVSLLRTWYEHGAVIN